MNKKWDFRTKIEILSRDLSSYAILNALDTDKYEAREKLCVLELDLEYLKGFYKLERYYLLATRENLYSKRQTITKKYEKSS